MSSDTYSINNSGKEIFERRERIMKGWRNPSEGKRSQFKKC